MWPLLKSLLTTDTAQWYETLPFVIGFIFVGIEPRRTLARRPRFSNFVIDPATGAICHVASCLRR
jgi:hypothetical protein